MGIRNINQITINSTTIKKTIKEGISFYNAEVFAYSLLKEFTPLLLRKNDLKQSITLKKIKGTPISQIKLTPTIIKKIALGLKYIHSFKKESLSFIHGDLNKDNVFLTENGSIVFIDFACSGYAIPDTDYAAFEIHFTQNPKLLKIFYDTLGVSPNRSLINAEKVKHAYSHLAWADSHTFPRIYKKAIHLINQYEIPLNENDFDVLGLIQLPDNEKISHLLTPTPQGVFLSRNYLYYKDYSYNELVRFHQNLKTLFPLPLKKAFVVCEYLAMCSYKLLYHDFKNKLQKRPNNYTHTQKVLEEDIQNIINCFEKKFILPPKKDLQFLNQDEKIESRPIESDHKWLLYSALKNIKNTSYVIAPLYSAVLIGPFMKILHHTPYSYAKFGVHDQNMLFDFQKGNLDIAHLMVDSIQKLPKNITIIDSNVGSGNTLLGLKELFSKYHISCHLMALEISFEMMEKTKDWHILNELEHYTFVSTRHHTLTDKLIHTLCFNPKNYYPTLKSMGLYNDFIPAISQLFYRGKNKTLHLNFKNPPFYECNSNLILSMDIFHHKIRYLEEEGIDKAINIITDFPKVNIIDLDKFYHAGANLDIIKKIVKIRPVRIGGGVQTKEDIQTLLNLGAEKVIIGTHANIDLLKDFNPKNIIVGLDSIDRRTNQKVDVIQKIKTFEPFCSEFNYVSVECDGKAQGGDVQNAIQYAKSTKNIFNCVGGINSYQEMQSLAQHNIGCTVGRKIQEGYFKEPFLK